jgi:predicted nucleic acid-binding protein
MEKLFRVVKVAAVDHEMINRALKLRWNDFEDCIQSAAARELDADYIVTRDMDGFKDSETAPITPADFLEILGYSESAG